MMGLQDDLGVFENGVPGVHFFKITDNHFPMSSWNLGGLPYFQIDLSKSEWWDMMGLHSFNDGMFMAIYD